MNWRSVSVLVTGGAGCIGGRLCAAPGMDFTQVPITERTAACLNPAGN